MVTYDIISLGGAVVDAFIDTGIKEKNEKLCVPMGAKLLVKSARFETGGGGTNTAVAFAKLGLKTGFIGKLGQDAFAEKILSELKQNKIDFLGAISKEEPTGYSTILDSTEHERTILTYKGANNTLRLSELSLAKLKTKWFYFSSSIDQTLETQIALANWARKQKIPVAYNPSWYLVQTPNKIKPLLKNVKVLVLNDEEARALVPKGDLFKGLHSLGPEYVCITYGEKGNKVSDGREVYVTLPKKVKVAERTGAGDAFAAGFVFGLIKLSDIRKAAAIGSLNAESVIQKRGAKNGLLSLIELQKQLKSRLK